MTYDAKTPDEYLAALPKDRQAPMSKLRQTILNHIPQGFQETINYGMIGYVIPHTLYPDGYHCDPKLPLPFINIASQKNYMAIYHMGLYADTHLLTWFTEAFPNHSKYKLDMGKSCIRFKKVDAIPFELIGELVSKITPQEWITIYESAIKC